MADPWAEFRVTENKPAADPWAEFRMAGPGLGETAYDVAASGAAGIGKGTAQGLGALGDLRELASKGANYVSEKTGINPTANIDPATLDTLKSFGAKVAFANPVTAPFAAAAKIAGNAPTSADIQGGIEKVTGTFHKPTTPYGKGAEAVGEFVPGAVTAALTGGGSLAGNLTRYAAIPGVVQTLAEKFLPEGEWKPYQKAALTLGSTIPNPARVLSPIPSSPTRQAAVDTLAKEGVTSLTAGQKTGSPWLLNLEAAAGGAPMGAGERIRRVESEGQAQFTDAALKRAGASGLATPEVLSANQKRLGSAFDELAAKNTLIPDNQLITDITNAVSKYRDVPASQQKAIIQQYIDDIVPHINAGYMPGEKYQTMRSMLGTEANSVMGSDPYLGGALKGMQKSLDRAMRRSISPEDADLWDLTRSQYSAQEVLKKGAARAGEATLEGNITPPNLRNIIAAEDKGGYSLGRGQFNELARAGATTMTPLPNSGTAPRWNAINLLNSALLNVPQMAGSYAVASKPVQAILANQLLTGKLPSSPAARAALIAELMKQQTPQLRGPNEQ